MEFSDTFYLKSFSGDTWYRISRVSRTCDCPEFRAMPGPPCQHLIAIGIHTERRPFVPSPRPSLSQALSGLVKSLRLRRIEDAVYWLVYLHTSKLPNSRFRMARRLLIGSAEDGHSVDVMQAVCCKLFSASAPTDRCAVPSCGSTSHLQDRQLVASAIRRQRLHL